MSVVEVLTTEFTSSKLLISYHLYATLFAALIVYDIDAFPGKSYICAVNATANLYLGPRNWAECSIDIQNQYTERSPVTRPTPSLFVQSPLGYSTIE